MANIIYKICPNSLWTAAEMAGRFDGSPVDIADGYIHFSTADQLKETAAKHFAGQCDLLLVAFDAGVLGDKLRWEMSRGGALFPHLYGSLDPFDAHWLGPLPLGEDGIHIFPVNLA